MADDENELSRFSDREWEQFERSFTDESTRTASHREPSARQRELTAKWRREPPRDSGWRNDGAEAARPPRELYPPVEYQPRRRKPTWQRNLVWILVMLLVVGAVLGLPTLFGSSPTRGGSSAPAPGPGTAGRAANSGGNSVAQAPDPNADDESLDKASTVRARRGGGVEGATAVSLL